MTAPVPADVISRLKAVLGPGGWSECQSPDGTVTITAPTGHRYSTVPGGVLHFPVLATATGDHVVAPIVEVPAIGRGLAMPTRQKSRDEERMARVDAERRRRAELNAEANQAIRAKHARAGDPPF